MGLALEPGGTPHQVVTATADGELRFTDFRAAGGGAAAKMGVYKSLEATSKGKLSALVAHPHAPIFATGTTTQVLLWMRLTHSCMQLPNGGCI